MSKREGHSVSTQILCYTHNFIVNDKTMEEMSSATYEQVWKCGSWHLTCEIVFIFLNQVLYKSMCFSCFKIVHNKVYGLCKYISRIKQAEQVSVTVRLYNAMWCTCFACLQPRGLSTWDVGIFSLRQKDSEVGVCKRMPQCLYEEDEEVSFLLLSQASHKHSWQSHGQGQREIHSNYVMC